MEYENTDQLYYQDYEQETPMMPYITVVRCVNCHTHQWCTRHIEQEYRNKLEAIRNAIEEVLPPN